MNTKNNQRFLQTEQLIKTTLIDLLATKDINKISVSEICKLANINRTTFYLHYLDVYDLMQKIETDMSTQMVDFFASKDATIDDGFIKLFHYIKEHQTFYQSYLRDNNQPSIINILLPDTVADSAKIFASRLGFETEKEFLYHQEFFKAGITALIKLWLGTGCTETPEEMSNIIGREYSPKRELFS